MNRKSGVAFSYFLLIAEVFSTLLFTPILIKSLGQAEFGVYKLVGAVTAYLGLLDLGIGNAIIRFMSKYRANNDIQRQQTFLGISTVYYLIVACIAVISGVVITIYFPSVFAKGLTPAEISKAQTLMYITTVNTAVVLGTSAYANTIFAYERFAFSKGTTIISTLLKVVVGISLLKCGMGSVSIVVSQLVLTVIFRVMYVVYVISKLKIRPKLKGGNSAFLKEVISYSLLILLQMVATQINEMADQVLLGIFAASASVIISVYAVGSQIVQYFQSIGASMNNVLMPGVVRMVEKGANEKELQNEMTRIGRLIFMVLSIVWVVFLVFGKDFIILWAGRENSQGYTVAVSLMLPYLLIIPQSIGSQILWAKNKHLGQSIIKISVALANIFLTISLIKWNPLIGATIGTSVSLLLGDVGAMSFVFKKDIGLNLKTYYLDLLRGIVPCLLITLVTGLLIRCMHFSDYGWIGLVTNCTFMLAVYCLIMWLEGMNTYEKSLVNSILVKLHVMKKP